MTYSNCFTEIEVDKFKSIKYCKVVFDIGTKDNIEYLISKPNTTYHLFEPVPEFFNRLKTNIESGGFKNIFLNNVGVGDTEGMVGFTKNSDSFDGSCATPREGGEITLPLISLDGYIEKNKIKRIDFIKIDTEGYDLKIVKGNPKAIGMTRYLQFETWDNYSEFEELLKDDFTMEDIGFRNVFCTRKI